MNAINKNEKDKINPFKLEKLKQNNKDLEIWWDSHPGFYKFFLSQIKSKGMNDENLIHMTNWMSHNESGFFFFDGVTTNPPLVLRFLDIHPQLINRLKNQSQCFKNSNNNEDFWFDLYWMVEKLGTDKFLSNFYRRGRQFGFVCVQVDPRWNKNKDKMLYQALKLSQMNPNAMIKIPATKAGLLVIEEMASLGIPINVTSCFCVPQVIYAAEAIKNGVEKGKIRGIDYSGWRSVITMMIGRWESSQELQKENSTTQLGEEDLRWFGVLMAKKAVEEINNLNAPTKVLVCSTRKGPGEGYLHLEELSKLPIVITMNAEAIEWGITLLREEKIEDSLKIPPAIEKKILMIDFAKRSLEVGGLSMDQIEKSGAQIYNLNEFQDSMVKIENLLK